MRFLTLSVLLLGLATLLGCQPARQAASDTTDTKTTDAIVEWQPDNPADAENASSEFAEFEIPAERPSEVKHVTTGFGLSPGSATAGNVVTVGVRLRIEEGWHIYAIDKPTDVQIPTTIELKLPVGFEQVGQWDIPAATPLNPTTFGYENEVTFRHLVRVDDSTAPGIYNLGCKVGYQSCTESTCTRPFSETVNAVLEVTAGE